MNSAEIRAIRGSLSRAAFARLLGVTALTVLRWELSEDSKEARRPRAKMVEALRRLAAEGVGTAALASASADLAEDEDADISEAVAERKPSTRPPVSPSLGPAEQLVLPLLDELCGEDWRRAEDALLGLLSSNSLSTPAARALATLGLVQVQIMARMDVRGALAVLVPLLDETERGGLPRAVAARAHVMAASVFSAPDSRVFDLGRTNAHAARAAALLDDDADDLRVMAAVCCITGARYLGPDITLRTYEQHRQYLERASSPFARILADGIAGLVATARNEPALAAARGGAALAGVERLGHWGLAGGILSDYVGRALRGPQTPDVVLEIARRGRELARAAGLAVTEGYIRLLAAECEALLRLARLDEAFATAEEALQLAQRAGLSRYSLTAPLARLYSQTERIAELRRLAELFERESAGPQGAGARAHADYLRSLAAGLSGDLEQAIELGERVCDAPELTPGLDYVVHNAHLDTIVACVLAQRTEQAELALRRFSGLLEQRPSIWHATFCRRAESIILMKRGRFSESRQRLEVSRATFALLGDVVQVALEDGTLAMLAKAAGAPDAEAAFQAALEKLRELGISTRLLEQRAKTLPMPTAGVWQEPSLPERLAVAFERLAVRGLDQPAFRRELSAVLGGLFGGRQVLLGGAELSGTATTVAATDEDGAQLCFGVRGDVEPEEHAALKLLAAFISSRDTTIASRAEPSLEGVLPEFVAIAPPMRRIKGELVKLSRSSATILILGESGSGKEVIARAVHDLSVRSAAPYVVFNCASVPRDLFESQLFGHRKGAFTGATSDNTGVIRAADGGTLFLDEIGELPLDMQPKLLRFLENGEILPVGEQAPRRVDVRVIAATHRDLSRLVREGQFREDLFYRLNVIPLQIPPLRERKEDLLALARLFMTRLVEGEAQPTFGADAVRALQAHSWPGNVRELRNVLERTLAYAPVPSVISAAHLRMARA